MVFLSFVEEWCPDTFPIVNGTGIVDGNMVKFECNNGSADPVTNKYMEFVDMPPSCTCDDSTWPKATIACKGNVTL